MVNHRHHVLLVHDVRGLLEVHNLCLLQDLQRVRRVGWRVPGQLHTPKRARAKDTHHLQVLKAGTPASQFPSPLRITSLVNSTYRMPEALVAVDSAISAVFFAAASLASSAA